MIRDVMLRPIPVSYTHLDQARVGVFAVRATGHYGAKAVQCGQRAAGRDFEDGTKFVGSALVRCPVEVPIGGLDQARVGVFAVRATGHYGAKAEALVVTYVLEAGLSTPVLEAEVRALSLIHI